jgi:hypothetical protein
MVQVGEFDLDGARLVADRLARSSNTEWIGMFEELRRTGRLMSTVHQLNLLLEQPMHRSLAISALRRMGLEHGG